MNLRFYAILLFLITTHSLHATAMTAGPRIVSATDTPDEYISKLCNHGIEAFPKGLFESESHQEFYMQHFLDFIRTTVQHVEALKADIPRSKIAQLKTALQSRLKEASSYAPKTYINTIFHQDQGVGRYLLIRDLLGTDAHSAVEKITMNLKLYLEQFYTSISASSTNDATRMRLTELQHAILLQYKILEQRFLRHLIQNYGYQMLTPSGVGQLKTRINQVIFAQYIHKYSLPINTLKYCRAESNASTTQLIAKWELHEKALIERTEHALNSLSIWIPIAQDIQAWISQIAKQSLSAFYAYEAFNLTSLNENLMAATEGACETCRTAIARLEPIPIEPIPSWHSTDFSPAVKESEIITSDRPAGIEGSSREESITGSDLGSESLSGESRSPSSDGD